MDKIDGMIDVGEKQKTRREATCKSVVKLNSEIIEMILTDKLPKGNVLEFARAAGIMAGKKTFDFIPLCHSIEIEQITVKFDIIESRSEIIVYATAKTTAKTGVEMEAMVACNIAALTIYDMCKMFSKEIEVGNSYLLEKTGGKSGHYVREI
ncbi:MAG: cyclic pyranopterin monophosphate synthase MoaC [Candidatus Delongbacteria bacterium]|nr:cyclic pyranopterin monophosphate synthase MoaC [Candidatus Delongbacteria bacterium]MBN2835470.1 cyclic pyranopterin monophosphate synthase MoaC [Candidatus Delongbacteria bacterium]